MFYEEPSMLKKLFLTDNIVRFNFSPSFKKLSKGFQIYGFLATQYGKNTDDFFSSCQEK